MIRKISAESRHFKDMGWLQTYWLFSFSSYYDPDNIRHGTLRVCNDDIVEPHQGFPTHPHEEMEIVSIVLDGRMEHHDTMGNTIVIAKNDVQRMSAGTGLHHSEWNRSEAPVHFLQLWLLPDKAGLTPSYAQKQFSEQDWHNRLALLAGAGGGHRSVPLNTDASIYRGALDPGVTVRHSTSRRRKLFVYVLSGTITLQDTTFAQGDQARIADEESLTITASKECDFILVDTPAENTFYS